MTAGELAARLSARPNGSGWAARCPAHEDRHASLSIGAGTDGRALVRCHAGCTVEAILDRLGLEARDLFVTREGQRGPARGLTARRFEIRDAAGVLVAVHVREDRPEGKRLWWERPGGSLGLTGTPVAALPPYGSERLAKLRFEAGVIVTEGEKSTEAIWSLGLPAVGTVTGASGCPGPAALEPLRGRRVILWPDADDAGRAHMARVAGALAGIASEVRILTWGEPRSGDDAADFVARGGTRDGLVALAKEAARSESRPADAIRKNDTPAPTGDAAPPKTARRLQGTAVAFEDPEPWPETVDGAALLDGVAGLIGRFVVLPEHAAEAIALWVLHTWTLDAADVTPLLALGSPTKRCGKTTLLRIIAALARRPLAASGISAAAIYRTVEQHSPTLLIDELDAAREDEGLRAVLNSGHTRDLAFVLRCVGEGAKMEARRFSTWCPKALAYIGRLAGTLEDRAIRVPMRRRSAGERNERFRRRVLTAQAEDLRRKLARWAYDAHPRLAGATPDLPDELDDRAADNWEPLLGIADDASGDWPDRARRAALALSAERPEDEAAENPGLLVLADLRDLIEADRLETEPGVAGDDACAALRELPERPWKTWGRGREGLQPVHLARLLRPFGCAPKQVRAEGRGGQRRYLLDPLTEAFERYLASPVARATPATGSDPLHASPEESTSVAGVAGVAGREGCSGSEPDSAVGEDL